MQTQMMETLLGSESEADKDAIAFTAYATHPQEADYPYGKTADGRKIVGMQLRKHENDADDPNSLPVRVPPTHAVCFDPR